MKNIYVGNLNYQTTEEELRELFKPYGAIERVTIPRDPTTLKPRGFAFVEMQDENAAREAILALNGSRLGDRTIIVSEARPKPEKAYTRRGSGERRFGRS